MALIFGASVGWIRLLENLFESLKFLVFEKVPEFSIAFVLLFVVADIVRRMKNLCAKIIDSLQNLYIFKEKKLKKKNHLSSKKVLCINLGFSRY